MIGRENWQKTERVNDPNHYVSDMIEAMLKHKSVWLLVEMGH